MTVRVKPYPKDRDRWWVETRFRWPEDKSLYRERTVAPVTSKSGAQRWGEERERTLLRAGKAALTPPPPPKEVPTLRDFGPRFIEGHARAARQKASGIATKESIFKTHLYPHLGDLRLDAITDERVAALKGALAKKSRKTVNNVLSTLSKLLKVAIKWKELAAMPCAIELFKVSNTVRAFYEFDDYRRLVEAAARIDTRTLVLVLLGGDAGLRRGEMIGLRWCDVDFKRRQLIIRQAVYAGTVDTPKSGHGRIVDMTVALTDALTRHRHLRNERVLCTDDAQPVTDKFLRAWHAAAQRRANLPVTTGALHILRHSFASHLTMSGAPLKAVQELMGHEDITTTMRYAHLAPSVRKEAIGLLDMRGNSRATAPERAG
jgi:integrase